MLDVVGGTDTHYLAAIGDDDRGYCGSEKHSETALFRVKKNAVLSVNTRG